MRRFRLRRSNPFLVAAVLCGMGVVDLALAQALRPSPTPTSIQVNWIVRIPMRDGVALAARIYLPREQQEPLPAIVYITPYLTDGIHERASYLARNGYVFVAVDCRGRGNSEGHFEPFVNEGRDGYDLVEWVGRQPWCNGKVAAYGGSYAGYVCWAVLKEFPPHLSTIVPVASPHAGVEFFAYWNMFQTFLAQWIAITGGRASNARITQDSQFWADQEWELYQSHRPFAEYDQIINHPSPIFQEWLRHPAPDVYLDRLAPSDKDFARMRIPILTITGHFDDDQPGALTYYRRHMAYGSAEGKELHYLLMGPWDHGGTYRPANEMGGLKFADASVVDMAKLLREWFDWALKGASKPVLLKQRVSSYTAGDERWRYADRLADLTQSSRTLYLHSEGQAGDVFHSGSLGEARPQSELPDTYVYDPLKLLNHEDYLARPTKAHWTSQYEELAVCGDGLVYHSAPLAEALDVTGVMKLVAWIRMDVFDTDFVVRVSEIRSDGSVVLLGDTRMRARYRESPRQEKLVKPGEINRYEFNTFYFTSRRLTKGSRLRLYISSLNSPAHEKNYGSGKPVALESGRDARTARITLLHDAERPSYLELPLGK